MAIAGNGRRGEDDGLPGWLRRSGDVAWRLVAVALAGLFVAVLARKLTVLVVPLALALLLAGVLAPLTRRLQHPRLPDWVVPLVAVLLVLVVVAGVVVGLGVRVAEQLPQLRSDFSGALQDLERRFSVQLPSLPGDGAASPGGGGSGGDALRIVTVGAEVLFGLFLTLALAFLFLKDGRSMWTWLLGKVGTGRQEEVDAAGRAAWNTVGTYVRGLTVVALFDAIGIGLGLLVLGVPLVATLATLQFLASYVPTIGAFVAGGVAVGVAFASGGFATAGLTLALVIVVQQLGADVVEPWVMGSSLPLHPAAVLVAVTAGAALWGIAGALLFVPLAAAGSAAGHVLWQHRHHAG